MKSKRKRDAEWEIGRGSEWSIVLREPKHACRGWSPFRLVVLLVGILGVVTAGCGDDSGGGGKNSNANVNTSIDPTCTTLRVTHYTGGPRGWCEFSRDLPVLPDFVHRGMTAAIAEPWNGGSYGGQPGEACGECWEVTSSWATEIVMITDLCPIEGNPICAGGFFHFDLLDSAAQALQTKGLDATSARRVPCPVTGNIHVVVNDWNQWGYMRVAFVNMTIPLREAWVRAAPDGDWRVFERSGGAWQIKDGPRPEDGPGVQFRLRSAQGQTVEGTEVIPFSTGATSDDPVVADLGAQFQDQHPEDEVCGYHAPEVVYGDEWGGIDELRWQPNPWGGLQVSETHENCHQGSASCLKLTHVGDWNGAHFYYYPAFPRDAFSSLTVWGRAESGTVTLRIGPSNDGTVCGEQEVTFTEDWSEVTFDLASACPDQDILSSVTLKSGKDGGAIFLDDIRFVP